MNVRLGMSQCAILRSVFPRLPPYHSLSLLKAVITGVRGPFTEREVLMAENRIRKAGYSPDSLLALLDIRRYQLD